MCETFPPNKREVCLVARASIKVGSENRLRYIADYGRRCWEVDVLPATIIEQAIDEDVRSRLDGKLWDRRNSEIERARKLL